MFSLQSVFACSGQDRWRMASIDASGNWHQTHHRGPRRALGSLKTRLVVLLVDSSPNDMLCAGHRRPVKTLMMPHMSVGPKSGQMHPVHDCICFRVQVPNQADDGNDIGPRR